MRVTQSMLSSMLLDNLNLSYSKMDRLMEMQTTGKKISKPSHDPVVASLGMLYRTNMRENEQFTYNTERAEDWLDATESALEEARSVLSRAKDLMEQAATDTLSPGDRQKIRDEMIQLREHFGNIANTTLNGSYLFSGTATDKPAYGSNGYPQQQDVRGVTGIDKDKLPFAPKEGYINENREDINLELSRGSDVPINVDGVDLFGTKKGVILPGSKPVTPQPVAEFIPADPTAKPDNKLVAGDTLRFTFDKELDPGAISSIQSALENTFGSGNVEVKPGADGKTFEVNVKSDIDISALSSTGLIEINKDLIKYKDGTTAGNDQLFIVTDDPDTFHKQINNYGENWEKNVFGMFDKIINDLDPSPYASDNYGRLLAAKKNPDGTQTPITEIKTMMVNGKEVSYVSYKLYEPGVDGEEPLLKPESEAKPKEGKELTGYLDVIQNQFDNFLQSQTQIGSRINRVHLIQERLTTQNFALEKMISDAEDANMARVIIDLQNNENVHRGALAAGSRIIQPSLLDFLR
jgi:flagellar hook-associated protein 3 FlgL